MFGSLSVVGLITIWINTLEGLKICIKCLNNKLQSCRCAGEYNHPAWDPALFDDKLEDGKTNDSYGPDAAHEEYLLVERMFDEASKHYELAICVNIIFCVGLFTGAFVVTLRKEASEFKAMMGLSAFFLIIIISLVSRVNRVTEHMKKMLVRSKPGDYAMIAVNKDSPDDSSHEWQNTVNENPIYYYTFGFPLKREHLWGLGTGLATAFAYAMLENTLSSD